MNRAASHGFFIFANRLNCFRREGEVTVGGMTPSMLPLISENAHKSSLKNVLTQSGYTLLP
jgi:hypothetical protein